MTNKEILEGDKLIAQFMGVKNVVEFTIKKNPEFIELVIAEDEDGYIDYVEGINYILYHSDWDQLMSVVEKIEKKSDTSLECLTLDEIVSYQFQIYLSNTCVRGKSKIEVIYKAVIEFIKWYNQNK